VSRNPTPAAFSTRDTPPSDGVHPCRADGAQPTRRSAVTGDENIWTKCTKAKTRMLELWRTGAVGAKVVAVRAIHRVIQTQTTGTADPRVSFTIITLLCDLIS